MLVACVISVMIFAGPTTILATLWSSNQRPLWQFSTYGKATSVAISPDGSYVAVGVQTSYNPSIGQVLLLNKTGSVLWARNSATITAVAMTVDGSRIAASGVLTKAITSGPSVTLQQTGIVYYFDNDGNQLWNYSVPLHYVNYPGEWGPPMFKVMLSQDGTRVVVDTGTGTLVFDSLGRLLWSYTPNCTYTVCPWLTLASANASFIVSINDQIHAFDGSGVSLWNSSSIPQPILVNGVMSKDGKLLVLEWENYFAANKQPTLILLDNTGVDLWNRTLSGVTSVLTMSSDDSAIVMSPGGRIASIDPQSRLLWNSTHVPGNLMITTSNGSYTAAVIALSLGHNVLRILDSSGRTVWGYGDFGEVDALALSGDDSFLAIATGPYANYSGDSATVVFLQGPKTLATERGPIYSWFTFDPNTQDNPWLFVFPAVFASAPLLYLLFRKIKENPHPQALAPSDSPD